MTAEPSYNVTKHELAGITVFEVTGSFNHRDIWELAGEKSRVATFTFALGSGTALRLGKSVVGVPMYSPKERAVQAANCGTNLRIEATMRDLSQSIKRELEHSGFPIADIASILIVPFDRPVERHEGGEKKIPNVITIPYTHDPTVNVDRLTQNLLVMKHNHGNELAPFEKEQLIGITLGLNDGHIDRRILEQFGFTAETAQNSTAVRFYRLQAKERQPGKVLSEEEAKLLEDARETRKLEAFIAAIKELQSSGLATVEDEQTRAALKTVFDAVTKFRPAVVLNWKRPVYWDLEGYVHIAMRHIREMQVGRYTEKTPFPYRSEDLESLIEKVLGSIRDDIHAHFEERPGQAFFRAGSRSVYFHGDYYSFHIDPNGRLTNFHALGPVLAPTTDSQTP